MRIFALIPVLAALATAVAGASLPRANNCVFKIDCPLDQAPAKRDFSHHRFSRTAHGLTNAELLRRGLPLNDPIIRRGTPVRRTGPSDTPTSDSDPKTDTTTTTTTTTTHTGNIRVRNANTNAILGWVSRTISSGRFVYQTGDSNALSVSFTTDSTGNRLNVIPENLSTPSFGFMGLALAGFDSTSTLASDSPQAVVLTPTSETYPGSHPADISSAYLGGARLAESAVWTYSPATGALSLGWVNDDGSTPTLYPFTMSDNGLYATGNIPAFINILGAVTPIVFEFVEATTP